MGMHGGGGGGGFSSGGVAPTYVPPIPIPSEQELLSRPPPTQNCDPFDETWPTYNIFVGDMTPDFTEADLYQAYQPAGPIHSVNVVKDKVTGAAKGFGFVNFLSEAAKTYALEQMKQVNTARGFPIRCFVSDAKNQLLVVGLPPSWSPEQLKQELERIGGPMIGLPQIIKPGHANVSYINYRRAEKALSLISGKPCGPTPGGPVMNASLSVGKPPPKIPGTGKPPATLFIKNIAGNIDEAGLAKYFGKYGVVTKSTVVRDMLTNESKGFGFIETTDMDEASKMLTGCHLTTLDGKVLSVEYAKLPDGTVPAARPTLGAGGVPIMPAKVPQKPAPRSRHQNDGDGGFNAPRGFSDAATEARGGLTVMDDAWTTDNVPAAAAIAAIHVSPQAAPILDASGKMIAFGYPGADDDKIGMHLVAPPQGAPSSTCRAQKNARQLAAQAAVPTGYDWAAYQNYGQGKRTLSTRGSSIAIACALVAHSLALSVFAFVCVRDRTAGPAFGAPGFGPPPPGFGGGFGGPARPPQQQWPGPQGPPGRY